MLPRYAIVLGAAVWPGGQPSPALQRRALHAAKLWHEGQIAGIVASGGIGRNPPSEARVIRDIVVAKGVPAQAVIFEARSHSTEENLRFSKALLPPGARAVIVSDAWHLPRARMIARLIGLDAETSACRADRRRPWAITRAVLREAAATLWLLLRRPFGPRA